MLVLLVWLLGAVFGYTILQPLSKVGRYPKRKTQYFLSDLLSLVVMLQLPCGFMSVAAHWHENSTVGVSIGGGLLSLVVVLIWWRAVGILSRLRVYMPVRRAVFLVVVLPVAILGSVFCVPLIFIAFQAIAGGPLVLPSWAKIAICLAVVAMPFVCYGFRLLTFWVLSGAEES
jgi:hypothetical protein